MVSAAVSLYLRRALLAGVQWRQAAQQHALSGLQRALSSQVAYTELTMPALSPTMSQGNLAKWYVKEGDEVQPGTVLADVETDKATMAFENQEEGFIAKILVPAGSKDVPIGTPVAIMVESADDIAKLGDIASSSGSSSLADSSRATEHASSSPSATGAHAVGSLPAHTGLQMPALSPTMERGNIVRWMVKEGDQVAPGDVLAEIETDKATLAFETQEDGFVARILMPDGSKDVPVGQLVAVMVDSAEDVPRFADYSPSASSTSSTSTSSSSSAAAAPAAGPQVQPSDRMGPAAKFWLSALGLSLEQVVPSGPRNIITKGDVLAAAEAAKTGTAAAPSRPAAAAKPAAAAPAVAAAPKPGPAAAPPAPAASTPSPTAAGASYQDTPNSQIRRIIAQRLLESKRTIPAIYVGAEAQLDALNALRKQLAEQGTKVSVNDFVVKAAAAALRQVPAANAVWDAAAQEARQLGSVDICVAVATERGLVTPIVKNADQLSLVEVSKAVKDLASRARDNKLKPEEFMGGSFTISNLGMYGISSFAAIINPPQVCILAVGGAQQRVQLQGGKPTATSVMGVTLSADSRAVDEEVAAELLAAFSRCLANPLQLVL